MAVYAHVNMVVIVPDNDATENEVREWIAFEIGEFGDIKKENPLSQYPLEIEENTLQIEID